MQILKNKVTDRQTDTVTSSLLELLVAAKNKVTSKQANKLTNKVTSSLLELLVAAKNKFVKNRVGGRGSTSILIMSLNILGFF